MPDLKHIAYRGYLRSCNYRCTYCPFSKQRPSAGELAKDQAALHRFADKVGQLEGPLTIQLLPYGEALVHDHYWQGLARLTQLAQVRAAGCQTNLSFDVETALALFDQEGGAVNKLRLWCTFHPTMTTAQDFAAQCAALSQAGVRFAVGAVGDPAHLAEITALRQLLPADVYLWINRLDGLKRPYTSAEKAAFTAIDPYFPLELSEPKADAAKCSGGRTSLFVQGDGACYSCNVSRRQLGNFYAEDRPAETVRCSARRCSCYLAYALREDIAPLTFFDQHPAFRVPLLSVNVKAVFFDMDGVLTDQAGHLRPRLLQSLAYLAQKYPLYLATQRPEASALRFLGESRGYFRGGIFADGAYIRPTWGERPRVQPLDLDAQNLAALERLADERHLTLRLYRERGTLYKLTLHSCSGQPISTDTIEVVQAIISSARLSAEGALVGITAAQADKGQAIAHLAGALGWRPEELAYVGNAACDVPIFAQVGTAIAIADGEPEALTVADYVLPI